MEVLQFFAGTFRTLAKALTTIAPTSVSYRLCSGVLLSKLLSTHFGHHRLNCIDRPARCVRQRMSVSSQGYDDR